MQHGVREVVICGIRTEQCCETTARVASDLGFEVTFVADATTTSGIEGLSAAEIIERTARVLGAREFATIATTDDVVAR
jgi:nicotinamidase-related amidase